MILLVHRRMIEGNLEEVHWIIPALSIFVGLNLVKAEYNK